MSQKYSLNHIFNLTGHIFRANNSSNNRAKKYNTEVPHETIKKRYVPPRN